MHMLKLLNVPFLVVITNTLSPLLARSDEIMNVTSEEEEVVLDGSNVRVDVPMYILDVSEVRFPALNFTANAEGSYNIEVSYAGSYEYKAASQNGTIKLVKENVKFLAPNRVIYASDLAKGYTYQVILKTKDGRALENRKVLVILNGKKYLAITDENGVATFNLSTNNAGEYRLTIRFAGDRYCNAFEDYRSLKAIKEPVYLFTKTESFKIGDANKLVSATLQSKTGAPVSNAKVTLEGAGVKYVATTNANGVASINVGLTQKGTFYANWAFGGTALYGARSATSKIVIG